MLNATAYEILNILQKHKSMSLQYVWEVADKFNDELDMIDLLDKLLSLKSFEETIACKDGRLYLTVDETALRDLIDVKFDSLSIGTGGTLSKALVGDTYYKLSYIQSPVYQGFESVNEVIANRLCEAFGFQYVQYKLVHAKVTIARFDSSFKTWLVASHDYNKGRGIITLQELCNWVGIDTHDELSVLKYILTLPNQIVQRFWEQSIIDFVICNVDRHPNNCELFSDTRDLVPIYDCGCSLGPKFCTGESKIESFDPYYSEITDNCIGSPYLHEMIHLYPEEYIVPKVEWSYDKVKDLKECFANEGTLQKKSEIISKRLEWLYDIRTKARRV